MSEPQEPDGLLDKAGVAKFLKVSVSQVEKLTCRKEIPCLRIGRSVRYDLADVRAWIEAKKNAPCNDSLASANMR